MSLKMSCTLIHCCFGLALLSCNAFAQPISTKPATAKASAQVHRKNYSWPEACKGFFSDTTSDFVSILKSPAHWDAEQKCLAGLTCGGLLATSIYLDNHVRIESQEGRSGVPKFVSKDIGPLGAEKSGLILIAGQVWGMASHDERYLTFVHNGIESTILASFIFSPVLKYSFGRKRPGQDADGADDFRPFSGNSSFPSGHTTQAFSLATTFSCAFVDCWPAQVAAYALAAGVGYSRIVDNQHYLSDVLAGMVLGTFVGREVSALNQHRQRQWTFFPVFNDGGSPAFCLRRTF